MSVADTVVENGLEMGIISIIVFLVLSIAASGSIIPDRNPCICDLGEVSSSLTCTLAESTDSINVTGDFCGGRISSVKLNLLRHRHLSSKVVPDVRAFRLEVTGEYLQDVAENAFDSNKVSLQFLSITESSLRQIPVPALRGVRYLRSLNLEENVIGSVNCSLQDTQITHLMLQDNQISTIQTCSLPENLIFVNLGNNRLETLNGSLRHHNHLLWVLIGRNQIASLKGELEGLDSVSLLDASWNKIETLGTTPTNILGLGTLNVSNNRISDLGISLTGFLNLNSLDLSHNDLESLNATTFNNLVNLRYLSLTANRIRSLDERVFENLNLLKTIRISKNIITSLDGKLDGLNSLKTLEVAWNNIRVIGNALRDLVSLEHLDLSHNRISDLGESLFTLRKLKSLNLMFNHITDIDVRVLSTSRSLQTLNLSFNVIKSLNGTVFASSPNLTSLDLSYNLVQSLSNLAVPGFMGISGQSTTEGASETPANNKCPRRFTKTLRLESHCSPESEMSSQKAILEENGIELIGC